MRLFLKNYFFNFLAKVKINMETKCNYTTKTVIYATFSVHSNNEGASKLKGIIF